MGRTKDLRTRIKNKFRKMSIQNQHIVSKQDKNIIWESDKGLCLVFQNNELTLRPHIRSNEILEVGEETMQMFADFTKIWLENEYLWKKLYSLKQAKQGKIDLLNAKLEKIQDYSKDELSAENALLEKYIQQQDNEITQLKDKISHLRGQVNGYKKITNKQLKGNY